MFGSKYIDLITALFTLFSLMYFGFTNAPVNSVIFFAWGIYVLIDSIANYYLKRKLEALREQLVSNIRIIKNDEQGDNDDIA